MKLEEAEEERFSRFWGLAKKKKMKLEEAEEERFSRFWGLAKKKKGFRILKKF